MAAATGGLTWAQKLELFVDGFTVLRGAVPLELVRKAKEAIDSTGATAVQDGEKVEFEQINLNSRARKASDVASSPEIPTSSTRAPFDRRCRLRSATSLPRRALRSR